MIKQKFCKSRENRIMFLCLKMKAVIGVTYGMQNKNLDNKLQLQVYSRITSKNSTASRYRASITKAFPPAALKSRFLDTSLSPRRLTFQLSIFIATCLAYKWQAGVYYHRLGQDWHLNGARKSLVTRCTAENSSVLLCCDDKSRRQRHQVDYNAKSVAGSVDYFSRVQQSAQGIFQRYLARTRCRKR